MRKDMEQCKVELNAKKISIDEEIKIKIVGLPSKKKIKIKASSEDYYCINEGININGKNLWQSYGVFISDENGVVDLSKIKLIEGTYNKVDSMGLFYSMKIKKRKRYKPSKFLEEIPLNKSYHVLIEVELENQIKHSEVIERYFSDYTIKVDEINTPSLVGRYFTSVVIKPRATIIVVSGSDGRIEKAQAIAQLFAMKGYSALAVAYFGLAKLPKELSEIPLEYVESAIQWLKEKNTVDQKKIGIYGRSKGGEYALLAGSTFEEITTVVAIVPSIYVFEGINSRGIPSQKSSWTYRGKNISFLFFSKKILLRYILRSILFKKNKLSLMYKELLEKNNRNLDAQIQLENIKGNILLISSQNDKIWPSGEFTKIAKEKYNNKIERYDYKNAGHMIIVPNESIENEKKLSSNIYQWQEANINAWERILLFLDNWAK